MAEGGPEALHSAIAESAKRQAAEAGSDPDALTAGGAAFSEEMRAQAEADRSEAFRTVVAAWKDQQTAERTTRKTYATWLLIGLGLQALIVNGVFVAIGLEWLTVDEWSARLFIVSVFAEIAGMVFFVVKYLFRDHTDKVFDLFKNR